MNRPINPRLIYTLRTAEAPLHPSLLAGLYPDPDSLEADVQVLRRHQMVHESEAGLAWAGS